MKIISSIFSDHKPVRLDINYREKHCKHTNTWRLKNMFQNSGQVTEKIKKKIKTNDKKKKKRQHGNSKHTGCRKKHF